ncbi:MAG: hypothetical protein HY553_23155 [Elusimicrobia bacterium]|nr:hypothetical protein [Elusimicrobiota bacterium]
MGTPSGPGLNPELVLPDASSGPPPSGLRAALHAIARVQLAIVTALLYYGLVAPYGLLVRALGRDPLDRRLRTGESYWKKRTPDTDRARYERQY